MAYQFVCRGKNNGFAGLNSMTGTNNLTN